MVKVQKVKNDVVAKAQPAADTKPKKAVVEAKSKSRDFSLDLGEYLSTWRTNKTEWKFNKVLQAWALESCFTKDLVDKNLFHDLLPYIGTVMGFARTRLMERADELIASEVEESENMEIKRARKILDKLGKTQEKTSSTSAAPAKSSDASKSNIVKSVSSTVKKEISSDSSSDSSGDEE
jgi:hypothetical protein